MGLQKTSSKVMRERRREIVSRMARRGFSIERMAEELGVAKATVTQDLAFLHNKWRERSMQSYGAWIAEELNKLDRLEDTLWAEIDRQHDGGKVANQTVDRMLKVMDRRAKLLGLDEPERIEVISMSAVESEIQRLEQELGVQGNETKELESNNDN